MREFLLIFGAFSLCTQPALASSSAAWDACDLAGKKPDEAIVACSQIILNGPATLKAGAYHNRGVSYSAKGNLQQALSDVSAGIRIDPTRAYRFQERGDLLMRLGEPSRALIEFNEAIRLDPVPRTFRFHSRGVALRALGNHSAALNDFNNAISLDPIPRAFRYLDRGKTFRDLSQFERAEQDFDKALNLEPGNMVIRFERAIMHARMGRADLALTELDQVLNNDQKWAAAFLERGRVQASLGRIDAARTDFERAGKIVDVDPITRTELARELAKLPSSDSKLATRPVVQNPSIAADQAKPAAAEPPREGLNRISGEWNNDASGENLVVRKAPLGWEAWISNRGQASLTLASKKGGNLEVATREFSCTYAVTFIAGERMSWALREGPEDKCMRGAFTRVSSER
jgi:tetratricopeptide (TPR) repeat protein